MSVKRPYLHRKVKNPLNSRQPVVIGKGKWENKIKKIIEDEAKIKSKMPALKPRYFYNGIPRLIFKRAIRLKDKYDQYDSYIVTFIYVDDREKTQKLVVTKINKDWITIMDDENEDDVDAKESISWAIQGINPYFRKRHVPLCMYDARALNIMEKIKDKIETTKSYNFIQGYKIKNTNSKHNKIYNKTYVFREYHFE